MKKSTKIIIGTSTATIATVSSILIAKKIKADRERREAEEAAQRKQEIIDNVIEIGIQVAKHAPEIIKFIIKVIPK